MSEWYSRYFGTTYLRISTELVARLVQHNVESRLLERVRAAYARDRRARHSSGATAHGSRAQPSLAARGAAVGCMVYAACHAARSRRAPSAQVKQRPMRTCCASRLSRSSLREPSLAHAVVCMLHVGCCQHRSRSAAANDRHARFLARRQPPVALVPVDRHGQRRTELVDEPRTACISPIDGLARMSAWPRSVG